MTEPTPPENVRLRLPDGTEIPVECRYDGVVEGVHRWTAITPEGVTQRPGMSLLVDLFPARSSISIDFDPQS